MNMKKNTVISAILVFMLLVTACGKTETNSVDTIGGKYLEAFEQTTNTDPNTIVDELIANVDSGYELIKMDVEPGYLNGFDNEITGFSSGVVFAPMIGSIPFVGYVFETDDAETLEKTLAQNANMRWNICTEADEMVTGSKGNLVFFMMCSNEDQ